MVNWLFKKPGAGAAASPKPSVAPSAPRRPAGPTPQEKAQARISQLESARADWAPRLQAAMGDDAALQRVASDCPLLDLKLSAIEAITGPRPAARDHPRNVRRRNGAATVPYERLALYTGASL